jgi:hypothetical protein
MRDDFDTENNAFYLKNLEAKSLLLHNFLIVVEYKTTADCLHYIAVFDAMSFLKMIRLLLDY